jgi:hypothetical protein
MNNALMQNGFLLVFQLAGGIAMGSVVRGILRRQAGCNSIFIFVWGLVFGGVPLAAGLEMSQQAPWLLIVQVSVLLISLGITALLPDIILDSLKSPPVSQLVFGSVFFVIGVGILLSLLSDATDLLQKLFMAVVFSIVGGSFFLKGVQALLQE